jgi:hypothetical protein
MEDDLMLTKLFRVFVKFILSINLLLGFALILAFFDINIIMTDMTSKDIISEFRGDSNSYVPLIFRISLYIIICIYLLGITQNKILIDKNAWYEVVETKEDKENKDFMMMKIKMVYNSLGRSINVELFEVKINKNDLTIFTEKSFPGLWLNISLKK